MSSVSSPSSVRTRLPVPSGATSRICETSRGQPACAFVQCAAIRRPSGDHAGLRSLSVVRTEASAVYTDDPEAGIRLSARTRARAVRRPVGSIAPETTTRSPLPSASATRIEPSHVKAIFVPSGDHAGFVPRTMSTRGRRSREDFHRPRRRTPARRRVTSPDCGRTSSAGVHRGRSRSRPRCHRDSFPPPPLAKAIRPAGYQAGSCAQSTSAPHGRTPRPRPRRARRLDRASQAPALARPS